MGDIEAVLGDSAMAPMFSCPVCREMYNLTDRPPMTIPCGHTICNGCMPGLMGPRHPESLMCPVCRKKFHQQGDTKLTIAKNYQLLEIIDRASKVKARLDEKASEIRLAKCRECNLEVPEYELTSCSCVVDREARDVDFMGRPKSTLICLDCTEKHENHDYKPTDQIKVAWDCHVAFNNLNKVASKIKTKAEACDTAIDNAKDELEYLTSRLDKTLKRLEGRPKSGALLDIAGTLSSRLDKLLTSIETMRGNVHNMGETLGSYSAMLCQTGFKPPAPEQPRNRGPTDPNILAGVPEMPVGDDGVLRFGRDGHFQVQFRIGLQEGVAEGFNGEADQLVDQVVHRRLRDIMPIIRAHIGGEPMPEEGAEGNMELRAVHRRVQLQRVNEGEEGIVIEMEINEVPLEIRNVNGNEQVVVGNDQQAQRRNVIDLRRRVQRAYELVGEQQEGQEGQEGGEAGAADEDSDEEAEVEEEEPAAPEPEPEPERLVRVLRNAAVRAAPYQRGRRAGRSRRGRPDGRRGRGRRP